MVSSSSLKLFSNIDDNLKDTPPYATMHTHFIDIDPSSKLSTKRVGDRTL